MYDGPEAKYTNKILPYLTLPYHRTIIVCVTKALQMCSDMPGRLQHMLNVLKMFCDKWGLKLNLLKTKILVFRRGGIVKQNEKWSYLCTLCNLYSIEDKFHFLMNCAAYIV